jgi:SAM-dependent methyltransferase
MIPDIAAPVVRQILAARRRRYSGNPLVLDVGCSYGINAAVHRFPVTFNGLRRRYTRHELAALTSAELLDLDKRYYASWPVIGRARFAGLDVSAPAVKYAARVGLIEHGIAADLETDDLSAVDATMVENVDVILSTGSVGYVTDETYRTLLASTLRVPWIISFVLRTFSYSPFADAFAEHGLVTERLASAVFVQRRFQDASELNNSLNVLEQRGIETDGFESDGRLRAELYLSRPAGDVKAAPLEKIVTVSSGLHRSIGSRYVRVPSSAHEVALEL